MIENLAPKLSDAEYAKIVADADGRFAIQIPGVLSDQDYDVLVRAESLGDQRQCGVMRHSNLS